MGASTTSVLFAKSAAAAVLLQCRLLCRQDADLDVLKRDFVAVILKADVTLIGFSEPRHRADGAGHMLDGDVANRSCSGIAGRKHLSLAHADQLATELLIEQHAPDSHP